MARNSLLIILFLISGSLFGQDRYMVFFTDKDDSPFSIQDPAAYLSERSLARREKYNIDITYEDLPVVQSYVDQVSAAGATVLFKTRWMNGVLVECDETLATTLSTLPKVSRVEWVAPGTRPNGSGRRRSSARNSADEVTFTQNNQIGIPDMHEAGYTGEGIHIAVLDAGFDGVSSADAFAHLFAENRVLLTYDFVRGQEDVFLHDKHGTEVLSVIGGFLPGTFIGGAHKATFQLYITEYVPSEHHVEEYNWLFAAERADSAGVDIINSSLGYNTFDEPSVDYVHADMDGKTAIITRAAEYAIDRGILVIVSAGNEGNNSWGLVTAPADGENVLSVGAINSVGERNNSSSKGPTADGRIKPDVMAMGVGTAVIKPNGSAGVNSGTSFAAPLITGLVGGILQRYPDLSPEEMIQVLHESSSQATQPDNFMGYGIPNFVAVVNLLEWEPQDELLVVYPNPVHDTLTIKPRSPVEITELRVEVVTLQGQQVVDQVVAFDWLNRSFVTDLRDLPAGVYILRVWLGDRPTSYKLVKV